MLCDGRKYFNFFLLINNYLCAPIFSKVIVHAKLKTQNLLVKFKMNLTVEKIY